MNRTRWVGLSALVGVLAFGQAAGAETTGQERAAAAGKGLVGSAAPRMVVKTIDGDTIDLGALYGKKAAYLKFWATWCGPCREQMPHFEHTYETAGPDLAVIAINAGFDDSVEEIQKYRRASGITMPIVLDDGRPLALVRVVPGDDPAGDFGELSSHPRTGQCRRVCARRSRAYDRSLMRGDAEGAQKFGIRDQRGALPKTE